jgi:hypothetical protein
MFRPIVAVAAVVTVLALVGVASAGNAHFAGKPSEPTFNDLGASLRTRVDVAGLGNFSTQLDVAANGTASGTTTCGNPGTNQTQAKGQNPAPFPVTAAGTTSVPQSDIKNGRVQISVTAITSPLVFTKAGAPDCPSPGWTETVTITDVAWTSAAVAVSQDTNNNGSFEEAAALSAACSFSPATSDGAVPVANVSC